MMSRTNDSRCRVGERVRWIATEGCVGRRIKGGAGRKTTWEHEINGWRDSNSNVYSLVRNHERKREN